MKYLQSSFTLSYGSRKYQDNWEETFGKRCPVCNQLTKWHSDDKVPGEVFVDGFGMLSCEELKEILDGSDE